jgi:hypothetical protein
MYSTDNQGLYARDLTLVTPKYLKTIPQCPAAKKETYSESYLAKAKGYTVYCQGQFHTSVGMLANYPQYNSYSGLILP